MPKLAYLDESGTASLEVEKQGVSEYFIVAAVIIDEETQTEFFANVEQIRQKHFQSSEIKSSGINAKNSHRRRKKILRDISELDFKLYVLAVNKSHISKNSGLKYKKSFIKNINGKIYSSLFQHFANIKLYADEHGDDDFISSLERYVRQNHMPDLFKECEFQTVKSIECLGAQVADFIAGTIAQIYEGKSDPELEERYIELIQTKSLGVIEWPRKYSTPSPPENIDSLLDQTVNDFAINQVEIYLEKNSRNTDYETKMKICILEFLLFKSQWISSNSYTSTAELFRHLDESGFRNVNVSFLRSNLIAKLRDENVLIASSNTGYKIPSKLADMYDFAVRVDSQVVPLLRRLKKARQNIYTASSGEVDIVKEDHFKTLSALLDAIEN